jgi:hypothetical protein
VLPKSKIWIKNSINQIAIYKKKMKRAIMIILSAMLLCFSHFCNANINFCHRCADDENKLKLFLKELRNGSTKNSSLYTTYIYINNPGQPDRNSQDVKYYTDTLFNEIGAAIRKNNYKVYPLASAKLLFKNEKLYDYYYDGQKNSIYVIAIKTEKVFAFYYVLMYAGKIVSLMPSKIADNGIVGWK